jgi:hypothetical protein
MRRVVTVVALAFGVAAPLRAAVDVTVTGDRVHVHAARAPLGDVLDVLARRTRMKVVYDGARPHTLVSVELRDRTPAQAVLGVLEGLGVSYALVMDSTGTEVETLMIVSAGAGGGPPGVPAPGKPATRHVPDEQPDVPEPEVYEERRTVPEEKEAVPEPPRPTPPPFGPLNPSGSVSPFAPGVPLPPTLPVPSPTPQATPSPNSSS